MNLIELLADNNFGDTRAPALAGPTGLVIILLLVAGTIFLIRNMNKRLKRLPESFPPKTGEFQAKAVEPERANGAHAEDEK
ncbi:hypothetical protein [Actinorhabdospora filicis]|uniref:hypothetical protein n=1 Tax=Actinorhabdospora filicis TaxID=1785913 RepID=UPI002553B76F|nr:hypothetical protein [Actinorhabdospora filicis]